MAVTEDDVGTAITKTVAAAARPRLVDVIQIVEDHAELDREPPKRAVIQRESQLVNLILSFLEKRTWFFQAGSWRAIWVF